jgi:hypothetical protein
MLATSVTLPAWVVALIAVCSVVSAVASAGGNVATFLIQLLHLRELKATVRKVGRHVGMTDEELDA